MTPDKTPLRASGAAARAMVADNERPALDAKIALHALTLPRIEQAERVCCYISIGKEVGTLLLIEALLDAGKHVSVPVVGEDDRMFPAVLETCEDLLHGRWGIPVPSVIQQEHQPLDAVVCPGVLFTRQGDRLGRGQGHYDRFLLKHEDAYAVGLCYETQLVDTLPTEPHDKPMHAVVTEAEIYG